MAWDDNILVNPSAETQDTTGWVVDPVGSVTVAENQTVGTRYVPFPDSRDKWFNEEHILKLLGPAGDYCFKFEEDAQMSQIIYASDIGGGVIIDSYSESNADGSFGLTDAVTNHICGVGQSFTGLEIVLKSCMLYMKKTNSPTGPIYIKIYAHTGVFGTSSLPTGAALAVSDPIEASTLPVASQLINFTFSGVNKISLVNGTKYVVTIEYANGLYGTNSVVCGRDASSPSHAGSCSVYSTSGGWTTYNTRDLCFYLYGDGLATQPAHLQLIGKYKLEQPQNKWDTNVLGTIGLNIYYTDGTNDQFLIPCVKGAEHEDRNLINWWILVYAVCAVTATKTLDYVKVTAKTASCSQLLNIDYMELRMEV